MAPTLQTSVDQADALEGALASNDENKLVEELKKIKTPEAGQAHTVEQILRQARSPRVRNAAAIALADMRAPNAANVLVELLSKPETQNSRGTLLYALEEVRGKAPLKLLIDIILSGTYEAREEANHLIASRNFKYTQPELLKELARLEASSPSDDEQASSIKEVAATISSLHHEKKRSSKATFSSEQLVARLAASNKLPNKKVKAVLKDFDFLVTQHLKRGGVVRLAGLGVLVVSARVARMKKSVTLKASKRKASKRIIFRPSKELRKSI